MLLLKGNRDKDLVIDAMMSRKYVCTIAYWEPSDYDYPSDMYDLYIVDSDEYGINELIECIEGIVSEETDNGNTPLMFLIIYTNEKEEDLAELFNWIESNRHKLPCRQVLVACK